MQLSESTVESISEAPLFIRPSVLAKTLGYSRQYVYLLIRQGIIPSCKVNGAIKVPRGAFETWTKGLDAEALASLKRQEGSRNAH
jgi:hypothetical protein